MTHASTESLVALLDGELNGPEERRTTGHIENCPHCSGELAQLVESRTLFTWALDRVDDAEPREWAAGIAAADSSTGDAPGVLPIDAPPRRASRRPPGRHRTALRWAAGLVLVAGAAAGAIVTPVIIERFFPQNSSIDEEAPPAVVASGGVAVQPVNGAAVVALSGDVASARLQVVFESRSDIMIDYRGQAPGFVARDGEISVRLADAATVLRLRVPRDVREVRVLVNGEPAALLTEGEVVGLPADSDVTFEVVGAER